MKFRFILGDLPWKHNSRRATRKDNPSKKTRQGVGDDLWDLANGYERPFLEQAGLLVPA